MKMKPKLASLQEELITKDPLHPGPIINKDLFIRLQDLTNGEHPKLTGF